MKQKMVIFGYTMDMGGAERALINIINTIKDYFEIDLVLIKKTGILLNDIPKEVTIKEIRKNIFDYVLFRYIPFFRRRKIRKLTNKKYDVAVAFMEGRACTWLSDMKGSVFKIAWIHNDVNKFDIGITENEIRKSYNLVDKIVVVSKQSKDSFCNKYDINPSNVEVVYNLIDEDKILNNSKLINVKKNKFTFINVSRMRKQKRHDRLLKAVKVLKDEGYDFELWLIGDGPLEDDIKKLVYELKIEDFVKLLGLKENPFPYIKAADYFVMSSDHEGYPLSLLEALLLKTPVISTDVSGAREILQDKYGIVCDTSLDALIDSMRSVLNKRNKKIEENLQDYKGGNDKIIKDLKKLFKIEGEKL